MNIYLVTAESGIYSDRNVWFVAAYLDEEQAKHHVEMASARSREYSQLSWDEQEELTWGSEDFNRLYYLPTFSIWDDKFRPYSDEGPTYALETLPLLSLSPDRNLARPSIYYPHHAEHQLTSEVESAQSLMKASLELISKLEHDLKARKE